MHLEEFIHQEFRLHEDILYLNHAAVSPWPQRTKLAVQQFAEENASIGSRNYPHWLEHEAELRAMLAQLINATAASDIALLKNTSEGLSVVAHGLSWQAGDNIVISDQEFPSNRIVWASLADRGVTVHQVDLGSADSPEQALIKRIDEKTKLLAISSVQYSTGLRMDLALLGQYCRQHGILFCVDAIQSIGAEPFDVQACHADFVAADGHKWMLGPEGLALFYCRAELREQLQLHQYGWHMVEHAHDFTRPDWQVATDARRFECGSPNMLSIHALHASVSLLLEVGLEELKQEIERRLRYSFNLLNNSDNLSVITPQEDGRFGGIVTFQHRQAGHEALYHYLQSQGVVCALRGGGIRFSPHFYTPLNKIEKAISLADNYSQP